MQPGLSCDCHANTSARDQASKSSLMNLLPDGVCPSAYFLFRILHSYKIVDDFRDSLWIYRRLVHADHFFNHSIPFFPRELRLLKHR